MPYLRVLMDRGLSGEDNSLRHNVWQKRYSRENREAIGDVHEYVVVYAKNARVHSRQTRNLRSDDRRTAKVYKNPR